MSYRRFARAQSQPVPFVAPRSEDPSTGVEPVAGYGEGLSRRVAPVAGQGAGRVLPYNATGQGGDDLYDEEGRPLRQRRKKRAGGGEGGGGFIGRPAADLPPSSLPPPPAGPLVHLDGGNQIGVPAGPLTVTASGLDLSIPTTLLLAVSQISGLGGTFPPPLPTTANLPWALIQTVISSGIGQVRLSLFALQNTDAAVSETIDPHLTSLSQFGVDLLMVAPGYMPAQSTSGSAVSSLAFTPFYSPQDLAITLTGLGNIPDGWTEVPVSLNALCSYHQGEVSSADYGIETLAIAAEII